MLDTVAAYIEQHHLLPENGEIIVAVSGGADSLCLLHLLNRLCGEGKRYPGLRLHVAHLDHRLRGDVGKRDAAAVAAIAAAWGLPVTIGEVDVPALARGERRSLEDAARSARYRFLREVARGWLIAVGHQADDQVETLLLHWLRGGGPSSLLGMLPRQQDIIRPLLAVSHAEIIAYCRRYGITPLEDVSNSDTRFLRNRIRHELLPLLESLNPGMRATLLRNAEVMRVDVEYIEAQIDAHWPGVFITEDDNRILLGLHALLALPLSIQRHLLRRATAQLSGGQSPLELRHYLLIEGLLHKKNDGEELVLDLPRRLRLKRDANHVLIERLRPDGEVGQAVALAPHSEELQLPIPGRVAVPGTGWVAAAEVLPDELLQEVLPALNREDWPRVWQLLPATRYAVYVDADAVAPRFIEGVPLTGLRVRARLPGDRIRPLGMEHEKKVQDILVDKHIARANRAAIPLFFSASHCIWLASICIDDRVRLTGKTRLILRLSIIPEHSS